MKKQNQYPVSESAVNVGPVERKGFVSMCPEVTRKIRVEYQSESDVFDALELDGALYIRREDVSSIVVTEKVVTRYVPTNNNQVIR